MRELKTFSTVKKQNKNYLDWTSEEYKTDIAYLIEELRNVNSFYSKEMTRLMRVFTRSTRPDTGVLMEQSMEPLKTLKMHDVLFR